MIKKERLNKNFLDEFQDYDFSKIKENKIFLYGADIDYDNMASKNRFIERGFKIINQFCWEKGQKPADILHYVKFKPNNNKC